MLTLIINYQCTKFNGNPLSSFRVKGLKRTTIKTLTISFKNRAVGARHRYAQYNLSPSLNDNSPAFRSLVTGIRTQQICDLPSSCQVEHVQQATTH